MRWYPLFCTFCFWYYSIPCLILPNSTVPFLFFQSIQLEQMVSLLTAVSFSGSSVAGNLLIDNDSRCVSWSVTSWTGANLFRLVRENSLGQLHWRMLLQVLGLATPDTLSGPLYHHLYSVFHRVHSRWSQGIPSAVIQWKSIQLWVCLHWEILFW